MKKLLCLLSVVVLTLTSCSNDSNEETNSSQPVLSILPKTVSVNYPNYPDDNYLEATVYNGNKIVSSTNAYSKTEYTYDGNVIVKLVEYDITGGKNSKSYEQTYTYANGKITGCTTIEGFSTAYPAGQYKNRDVYVYNTDGNVSIETYRTDTATGVETKGYGTYVKTFANGNLVKTVSTSGIVGTPDYSQLTRDIEYDAKNSPTKNILGLNLLLNNDVAMSVNNVINETVTLVYGANSTVSGPLVYSTKYEYNVNGYPTKATAYKPDGITVEEITEYAY